MHYQEFVFSFTFYLLDLQNMWDLTPDTELLRELPEEYTFETALADLIVSHFGEDEKIEFISLLNYVSSKVLTILLFIYQDNSLQAVWSNHKDDRRLVRYDVM